jgi:hypothetical protein
MQCKQVLSLEAAVAKVVDANPPRERLKALLASAVNPSGDLRAWPILAAVNTAVDIGAPANTIKALANSAIVLQAGLNVPSGSAAVQQQLQALVWTGPSPAFTGQPCMATGALPSVPIN